MFPPVFPPVKQICSRQSLTGLVTVFCFFTTSVGFPLEPVGTPQAGCQCGHELQSSGGCCCSLAQTSPKCESQPRSCCAKKQTRSCCTGKSKQETDQASKTALVSACGCSHGPVPGLLVNDDPRLPAQPTLILSSTPLEFCCPQVSRVLPEDCLAPETPPPEMCCL
ncbi:hypothetical protein [Gimesia algae]|uniref:Uncharacterized protein n=1 Tax=Gimesia algae TaxID=2527971 RepID=A0A517V681_9PLAN|nr:hypothetical protein [Gimesia algae]QDT88493.1 hypothetical protein Pan161_01090 [Gimesia algae]